MKRVYSFLLAVMMVLSAVTMSYAGVAYAKADANTDLTLVAKTPKVKSGDTGLVELDLKIAGSQESIQESFGGSAILEIKLPENVDYYEFDSDSLSDYSVDGVVPIYSSDSKALRYELKDIKTGLSSKVLLPVKTVNGITPNGTSLVFNAKLLKADNAAVVEASPAKIDIESVFNESISKKYIGVVGKDDLMPKKDDTVKWLIKGSISIPSRAAMYIEPGSDITIKDILPQGLEFVDAKTIVGDLSAHKTNGQEITWTAKAPTIKEQELKKIQQTNLFDFEVEVTTKVTLDTLKPQNLTNEIKMTANDISSKPKEAKATANVTVLAGGNDISFQSGSWYPAVTAGPKDGNAEHAYGSASVNPNPAVYDTARLRMFEYYNIALNDSDMLFKKDGDSWVRKPNSEWNPADVFKNGYKKIVTKQTFSDELIFDAIFVWTPKIYYHSGIAGGPLPKYPKTTFTFNLEGGATKTYQVKFQADGGSIGYVFLDRKEMGLADTDHVLSYDIEYSNEDGKTLFGGVSLQTFPQFSIKKGTVGEVQWRTEYETTLSDGSVYLRKAENKGDNIGPRNATVVQATDTKPKVMATVEFANKDGNVVKLGDNRVVLKFFNGRTSQISMDGAFSSAILLPYGVKLKENANFEHTFESSRLLQKVLVEKLNGTGEVIDANYKGTGQQLIKVTWNKDTLQPGNDLAVMFDVEITDDAPNSMNLVSYTASSNTLKLESMVPDTAPIQEDIDDINQDKVENQQRIKAQNAYRIYSNEDLKIEKFVKGNLDKEFSKFAHASLGGKIEYKLNLTNTTKRNIYSLGFMDVLPSVNDLGIVDNAARQSAFTPLLSGPIRLPDEWADKIDVYYSTSKNPSRADLYSKVNYDEKQDKTTVEYKHEDPVTAENPNWKSADEVVEWKNIHSFKLELKKDVIWVKGENISLSFEMTAPKKGDNVNLPNEGILFSNFDEAKRNDATELKAAWNSFAVTTNGLLPTEPERVGVVLFKDSGAVRVKYFIEGTEIELDNPKAGERVKDGDDKGWYTVKEKGSEVGEKYDTKTDEFQPKTLVKDGKSYVLTEKKIRDDSDPVDGETKPQTQYIIYEYRLLEEKPNTPSENKDKPKSPTSSDKSTSKNPKTGDESNMMPYALLLSLSSVAALSVCIKKKVREKDGLNK